MSEVNYYVIWCSEDGEIYLEPYKKLKLVGRMNDPDEPWMKDYEAVEEIPNWDLQMWGNKYIVIKGEIVVPEAREIKVDWII